MKNLILIIALLFSYLLSFSQTFSDSNLPIVIIETDGGVAIPDEPKVLGNMKIIWHQDGSRNYLTDINNPEFLNYDGRIGIEIRGSSSQQFLEKKSYGLETLLTNDTTNNNISLLGMPKENDWILNALAFDQTGMRDVISYELSEKLGHYTPRRVYCEVIVNGEYKGLYAFMEKIKVDDGRVNIDKDGGHIVQTDRANGDLYEWAMEEYGNGWWTEYAYFVHEYPKTNVITAAQHNYIKNVFFDLANKAGSHNISIENGITSIIDIPTFVDFMIMGEFSSNVDVYQLSTFFHKDNKGKLRAGPIWDYNLSYGHDEFGNRSLYYVWQFDNGDNVGPKFWKDLFDTNEFRCYLARRWFEVTSEGNALDYNALCNRMDEISAWISEAVARDNQRWHKMEQHTSEVQAMKEWIQQRINWLNDNISASGYCDDVDLPPLVISKIHYHPMDFDTINGNRLEFIQINNNGDADVDLTGIYLSELGVTYRFPNGSRLAARDSLVLCSDSTTYVQYYNKYPFGQYERKLSNKSEKIVIADAWGNVIDEVNYSDSAPWPTEPDGNGPYLQLIDLDADNSLAENWTFSSYYENVDEFPEETIIVFPNPTSGIINFSSEITVQSADIFNIAGKKMSSFSSNTIDCSALPNGLYSLRITTEKGVTIKKIAVIH